MTRVLLGLEPFKFDNIEYVQSTEIISNYSDGVRTPFLKSGSDYSGLEPHDLARSVLRNLIKRTKISKSSVEYIVFGSAVQVRGVPVKKFVQSLSGMLSKSAWQPDYPNLTRFVSNESMGHHSDRLAAAFHVDRLAQDQYAHNSLQLTAKAAKQGLLVDACPFKVPGSVNFIEADNGIQPQSLDELAKHEPLHVRPYGTVTSANSTFPSDGASACLITSAAHARVKNWKHRAYLRDFVYVGHDPKDHMLLGIAYAIPSLLDRNGLTLSDIDVYELYDPFAGQLLANAAALDSAYFCQTFLNRPKPVGKLPMDRVNAWGGCLALGHPMGATGIRLVTTAVNRLNQGGQLALVAVGGPGGLGHAMLLEAC